MEALQNGAFKAYYQPKVETDSYRIVGAEALARLEYEGRLVPPMKFVPVLERNGMVCTLDFYILEQVCKDIRGWLREGIEPVRVSVNLSREHLANPHLCEDIMGIIGKYELCYSPEMASSTNRKDFFRIYDSVVARAREDKVNQDVIRLINSGIVSRLSLPEVKELAEE